MQPARGRWIANRFPHGHRKRDDIVLHASLELLNPCDIDLGARSNGGRRFLRHLPCFRERFRRGNLYLEPLGELVGVAPDVAHFLARVAWNHFLLLRLKQEDAAQITLPHDTADKAGEWMPAAELPPPPGVPFESASLRYLV